VLGDDSESRDVGDEKVVTAVGGLSQPVWLKFADFELRCESAVLWGDRERLMGSLKSRSGGADGAGSGDLLGNVIHAVYAEGKVFVRRDKYTFHADRVLLDFRSHRAYLVNAVVEGRAKNPAGRDVPLSVRAGVVRGISRDRFRAENAVLTSCTYEHPHLAFTTSQVDVDFSKGQPEYETSWWPTLRADTVVADGVPLLPLPKLGGEFGTRPIQTVELSTSNRFGTTLGLGFGGKLDRDDGSTWGSWQVIPRYRSDRGAGVGFELDHEGVERRGGGPRDVLEVEGDYQRDTQDTDSFSERPFDGMKGGDSRPDRGRLHLWSRSYLNDGLARDVLGDGWRLDAEVSWWSDRGYLPEYDADTMLQDKPQETFAQLRKTWGNQGLSILGSYRLPDEAYALHREDGDEALTTYAYQTDYLPSATWHLVNQPVVPFEATGLAPLNLSVEAGVTSVERRLDETQADELEKGDWSSFDAPWTRSLKGRSWESTDVLRGDLESRVTAPFELGPVQVTPAFGGSLYHVSDANGYANAGTSAADESQGRSSAFYALRVGSEAHREFDARSDTLALSGLRHVVSGDAQWFHRFHVSDDAPLEFQTNDLHDQLFEQNVMSFRLRNRLQTKRDGESVDWIDYEARLLYYVDETEAYRGTGLGVREDFASPLERLDFPGEEKYLGETREGSAVHQHRARIEVLPTLWLIGEADYDMTTSAMETSGVGVRLFPDRRFSAYVGRRTIHEDSAIWTLRGDYRLSDKWGFTGEFQYDTKDEGDDGSADETNEDGTLRSTLGLYRRSHDLTIAIEFQSEQLLDETGISFVVYPHDWLVRKRDPFSARRPLDFATLRWYR
jgi:hypothetical protein